ncbi:MAG TPA: HAD family phosphatase [Thermoanaerobaculia bacterium]|nr:HAD family phosphatase [Thermoanaerobaculia bacterium]
MRRSAVRPITAAIFDFDETIVDLERQHTEASIALCRQFGEDFLRMPQEFRFASGSRIIDYVREIRDFFGWTNPVDELAGMRERFFLEACRSSEIRTMPGAEAAIRRLHDRGLRLAIASSSVASSIDEILRRLGLRGFFQEIVDGSRVQKGKPDPEAYLVTARELGVPVDECVVFEDSQAGVLAARAAAMLCIAVRNPGAKQFQDLTAADLIVTSFEELDLDWIVTRTA